MKMSQYFIFLVLCINSCSFLPEPGDETKKFTLDSLTEVERTKNKSPKVETLIIDQPTVYPPLDQTRVAIKPTPSTIDYIADIEWADRLGVLIYENMIQSFQNSGVFKSVGRLNAGLDGKYLLGCDVRKFFEAAAQSCVEVEYFVQLSTLHDRQTIATQIFNVCIPLVDKSEIAVMAALNQANQNIMKQILTWVEEKTKS